MLFLSLLYRLGNGGTERLSNLPKVAQRIGGRDVIQTESDSRPCVLSCCTVQPLQLTLLAPVGHKEHFLVFQSPYLPARGHFYFCPTSPDYPVEELCWLLFNKH